METYAPVVAEAAAGITELTNNRKEQENKTFTRLWTAAKVAEYLDMSENDVMDWANRRQNPLPSIKISSKKRMFVKKDVDGFISSLIE